MPTLSEYVESSQFGISRGCGNGMKRLLTEYDVGTVVFGK